MRAGPAVSSGCGGAASDVLLDAAHNPAGARALAAYLREIGWTDVTLVIGVMRDKDVDGHAVGAPSAVARRSCARRRPVRARSRPRRWPRSPRRCRRAPRARRGHPRSGDGHGRRLQGRRTGRRRRINLSHRSAAWYSSLISRVLDQRASVPADALTAPALRMHRRILFTVVAQHARHPRHASHDRRRTRAHAQTPQSQIAGCRVSYMRSAHSGRARRKRSAAAPRRCSS